MKILYFITEPVEELTLVEKASIAVECGNEWFDDLDYVIKAESGLNLQHLRPDATVTECPVLRGSGPVPMSLYTFHHA